MTVCNMSIEGGARCGYVNPDETTIDYLRGRAYAPQGDAWDRARRRGGAASRASRTRATTTASRSDGAEIEPTVTWGINPGQSSASNEPHAARLASVPDDERAGLAEALDVHGARAPASRSRARRSTSPSSARARTAASRTCARRRASRERATWRRTCARSSCPARRRSQRQAEAEGLDQIFRAAGFEWREAGCSMCLAMNPDKLRRRPSSARRRATATSRAARARRPAARC